MFNCEKLKNENCAHCNQGIVQDVHVRKNHTKTCECVSERNIVTMDECFRINAPQ